MKRFVLRGEPVCDRYLEKDTLRGTKVCADVALLADISRVRCEQNAKLAAGHVDDVGLVVGERDVGKAL